MTQPLPDPFQENCQGWLYCFWLYLLLSAYGPQISPLKGPAHWSSQRNWPLGMRPPSAAAPPAAVFWNKANLSFHQPRLFIGFRMASSWTLLFQQQSRVVRAGKKQASPPDTRLHEVPDSTQLPVTGNRNFSVCVCESDRLLWEQLKLCTEWSPLTSSHQSPLESTHGRGEHCRHETWAKGGLAAREERATSLHCPQRLSSVHSSCWWWNWCCFNSISPSGIFPIRPAKKVKQKTNQKTRHKQVYEFH